MRGCHLKTMQRIVVLFSLLYFTKYTQGSGPKMVLGPDVQSPCLPYGWEEIDNVEEPDELVNNMFEAYKEQAKSETPEAQHEDSLVDVDAHELLGRLFFYIRNHLEKRKTNPDHDITLEDGVAMAIFQNIHSNKERWTTNKKWWPYRCYNVETIKALDLFLSKVILTINQDSRANEHELAAFLFGLITSLPQFENYAQNLHAMPFDNICSLIQTSENYETAIRDIMWTITAMTSVSQVACQSPYERQTFCNLVSVNHDLKGMSKDIEQAGSSTEMKKFAFFWFYGQGLSKACEDSFISTQFRQETLVPFAQSAVARLNEIISLSSTTGRDLEKIRTFIYDFIYFYFTRYTVTGMEMPWRPKAPFDGHDNKYMKFSSLSRTDVFVKPQKDLLRCFRTFIQSLTNIENAIIEGAEITKVHALTRLALLWFLHPDFQLESEVDNYNTFLEGLSYLLQDSPSLINFGKAVQHYDISSCGANTIHHFVKFCKLYEVLFDIRIYATTMEDAPTTKILNPATNYKKILELKNMRSIQTDIAALQVGQEQLEQSLFNMRSSLGDHFHQLATFDQDKAEYDVGFLIDKIEDFTARIVSSDLKEKLSTLIKLAVAANTAELVQLGTQLAGAIAENFNPLKWLAGGGGVQDVLDQANDLAQQGVNTAKLVNIGTVLFELAKKAKQLSNAMAGNAEIHRKLNTTFHQLKDKESIDVDNVQANFLIDYRGYDPGWSSADIAKYTVLLKGVIDELCDILYGGNTIASAVSEGIGASEGVCLNIKTNADVVEAVYNEMYDFQYEFMEAMAVAVRALVTKHSADTVRNLPEEADDSATYRLQLKFYAYRIKLQSKQHILLALKDVCDVDEFKNGGVPTDKCERALASQSNADIDRVIGEKVNECPSGQVSNIYARIPAKLNPDQATLEPGTLDLTKLYSGDLTSFRIPFSMSAPWLYSFVSDTIPVHEDVALYLKRFELFLPDLTSSPVSHDITITIKQDGAAKVLQSGQVKYGFATPKVFTLTYGENKHRCMNGFDDSAYPKLCEPGPSQVCKVSRGEISENEMAPPLHGRWLIHSSLPGGLPLPKPSSKSVFYLRAALSICVKNPKNIDLSDQGRPSLVQVSPDDMCCPRGQFWYISPFLASFQKCFDCPANSTPKLGGLYCHDDDADKVSLRGKSKPNKHGLRGKIFGRHKVKGENEKRKMKKNKKN